MREASKKNPSLSKRKNSDPLSADNYTTRPPRDVLFLWQRERSMQMKKLIREELLQGNPFMGQVNISKRGENIWILEIPFSFSF